MFVEHQNYILKAIKTIYEVMYEINIITFSAATFRYSSLTIKLSLKYLILYKNINLAGIFHDFCFVLH